MERRKLPSLNNSFHKRELIKYIEYISQLIDYYNYRVMLVPQP